MNINAPSILVVVPAYNEAENIPALIKAFEDFQAQFPGYKLRALVVDDFSSDQTPFLIDEACKTRSWLSYMQVSKRGGSHAAVMAGMLQSNEDYVAFIAADLQDPVELIPEMIDISLKGHDVIWAVRASQDQHDPFEYWTSKIFCLLMEKLSNVGEIPFQPSFAVLTRKAVNALKKNAGPNFSLIVEIPRLGFSVASLPFHKKKRMAGVSKWTLRRKLLSVMDAVVSSSFWPLRAMSVIGFVTSLFGFLYAAFLVVHWFVNPNATPGWTSIIVIMLILGGLQMLMLGVIGEYLWRTNEYARGRSLFNINKSANIETIEK